MHFMSIIKLILVKLQEILKFKQYLVE